MAVPVDKQLFAAVRSGDKERIDKAFEQVYVAYVKLVAFVVGKYVGDGEVVKEIVNDVFLGFFNNLDRVKDDVKYYLVVCARNAAVNYVKKSGVGREVPLEYASDKTKDCFCGTGAVVGEMRKILSDEQVDIILLHVVEGYSFKEIAKMKVKSINTVITIYNRAIKKYRKEVEKL